MALGAIRVGARQMRAHVLQADAVLVQRGRIQIDAHRRQRAAAHLNLTDALDLRQLLRQDRGGGVVHLALLHDVGRERQNQYRRIGRIDFAIVGIARQRGGELAAGRVDRGLHIARGAVDVAIEVELQNDVGRAQRAGRSHLGHAGDAAQLPLERRRHRRRHILGLAPGSDADTLMVGKSTCGSGATGSNRKAITPASASPAVSSVVATGRLMNGAEMFKSACLRMFKDVPVRRSSRTIRAQRRSFLTLRSRRCDASRQSVEGQVDHRRRVQRQQLADDQAADDGDTERAPQLRPNAAAERQRQRTQQRRQRGHQDRTEAQQARLIDRVAVRSCPPCARPRGRSRSS